MLLRRLVGLFIVVPSVAFAGFEVSSFKKEHKLGENYWNVASALDGKPDTCWMVDPEGENVGEWLQIGLPKGEIDNLRVIVGWDKDEKSFTNYARMKAARVEVFTQENSTDTTGTKVLEHTVTFEDKPGWQVIDLPNTKVGSEFFGGHLRMTITEVYEGRDYPYLAVSDVLVGLAEMPAKNISFREEPGGAADGHSSDMMLDGNAKTFWASAAGGDGERFRVQAEGFGVSSLGITPGPSSHARPKTVEVIAADVVKTVTLQDSDDEQWIELPAPIGYTGSAWGAVEVTVVDTYPGKSSAAVGIAEVQLKATNYEGF